MGFTPGYSRRESPASTSINLSYVMKTAASKQPKCTGNLGIHGKLFFCLHPISSCQKMLIEGEIHEEYKSYVNILGLNDYIPFRSRGSNWASTMIIDTGSTCQILSKEIRKTKEESKLYTCYTKVCMVGITGIIWSIRNSSIFNVLNFFNK